MKKITTNTKVLLNAVATANNYTSRDGDFAGMITIVGNDGQMEIKATDNMQTIVFKNIGYISSDLTDTAFEPITLEGKKLATVLKAAKTDEVIIELDDNFITAKSGRSRAKIDIRDKNQEIEVAKGYGTSIDLSGYVNGMNNLVHAIDQNNPKFELNGLLFRTHAGKLEMVATDSRRLAVVTNEIGGDDDIDIILPKQTINTVTKLFGNVDVEAEADGVLFSIHSPFVSYSTKLISGKFPDYKRIVPQSFSQTISLNTASLAEVVAEASMFETDIIVEIKNQTLKAMDVSGNTEACLPEDKLIDIHTDLRFAVNARYILDVLSAIDSETVDLCFNESNIPFVLKTGNFEEVIMPVQLPDELEEIEQEVA